MASLVTQSWNHLVEWLRRLENLSGLRDAAPLVACRQALAEEVVAQLLFGDKSACLTVNRHQSAPIYCPVQRNRERLVRLGGEQTPHLDVAAALCIRDEAK